MKRGKRALRPLAPGTYLIRNLGKTAPLTAVLTMAVMLVAGIVAMMNSIPYSINTVYSYSKKMLALAPMGGDAKVQEVLQDLSAESPVPLERTMLGQTSWAEVRSLVGQWPFVVVGLRPDDQRYYLERLGGERIEGRLPAKGAAEVVISEPVARNLGLRLGEVLLSPEDQGRYAPVPVHIVGVAETQEWLMLADYDFVRTQFFPPLDRILAFASTDADQETLGRWAETYFKGKRVTVFAYHQLARDTEEMFATLYRILNVVIGTLVVVITIMMGMLINIYQSQRLVEFGLLQAIGYTRRDLLSRVLRETFWVVLFGWLLGVAGATLLLYGVEAALMRPNAYAIEIFDRRAIFYTLPVPLAIFVVAALTVGGKFRKFDPVGIVERRIL